jgi:hypothetical protein
MPPSQRTSLLRRRVNRGRKPQRRLSSIESLESRQLLAGELLATLPVGTAPALQAEVGQAIASGNWSDASIWSGGSVPSATSDVTIEGGHTVTYDLADDGDMAAEARTITVTNGGALYFSRTVNTRLDLDGSLIVLGGGVLDVGTTQDPIENVTTYIGFNVSDDRLFSSNDPNDPNFQPGPNPMMPDFHPEDVGIWGMGMGTQVSFHGTTKPTTWTKLTQDVMAGESVITLRDTPTNWRAVLILGTGKKIG